MLHMIEHVFVEQSLVAAFAVVGAVMWISLLLSKRLSAGRIHGSAIAIVIGLVLAYVGGLMTGGQKGLADIPVFAGIGLMGGAMLRDFAIVATAFEVDVIEARKAGMLGVVALALGTILPFIVGAAVAMAFGYTDAISITTIGAGAITYIVGPVTGAALGADSTVVALSIATGVFKAVLVMVGTPLVARFIGLDNPFRHGLRRFDGHRERSCGRTCRNRPEAGAVWRPHRDLPHRHRLPGRAVPPLPGGSCHGRVTSRTSMAQCRQCGSGRKVCERTRVVVGHGKGARVATTT